MSRPMSWVEEVVSVQSIENADNIVEYTVGGWNVVDRISRYSPGELVVYLSIDSWVPTEIAPFLSKGEQPREYNSVPGERLRTVRLRKTLSQGLILPISIVDKQYRVLGQVLDEVLNIQKYEPPIPAQLRGISRGNFPVGVPKTDQERIQNLSKKFNSFRGIEFEVTEKLHGSSCTWYLDHDNTFSACSRNINLKANPDNSFWSVALRYNVESVMKDLGLQGYAIQGELVGPGIQKNMYAMQSLDVYVFDVYNVKTGKYLPADERIKLVSELGLNHVPVYESCLFEFTDIPSVLLYADGRSALNNVPREGLVFKARDGSFSFKAVSNKWLLKYD